MLEMTELSLLVQKAFLWLLLKHTHTEMKEKKDK